MVSNGEMRIEEHILLLDGIPDVRDRDFCDCAKAELDHMSMCLHAGVLEVSITLFITRSLTYGCDQ